MHFNNWYQKMVSNLYNKNQIGRTTTSGAITEYTIPTASSVPIGITSGGDGNLWFTESSKNQIGQLIY